MTTTNTNKPATSKPVFRKQMPNGIGVAVFQNTHEGRTYRSVNLQRSYRKNGEWKRMSLYLDHEHIPFVIEALDTTWKYLNDALIPTSHTEAIDDSHVESPVEAQAEDAIIESCADEIA